MTDTPGPCFLTHMATFRYDHEVADELCERISEGETLTYICKVDGLGYDRDPGDFPSAGTVYSWCRLTSPLYNEEFCARFSEAMIAGQNIKVWQTIDIASTPEYGEEVTEEEVDVDGEKAHTKTIKRVVKKEMLGHRTLKINTIYRALEAFNPTLWSNKLRKAEGDDDNTIVVKGGLY